MTAKDPYSSGSGAIGIGRIPGKNAPGNIPLTLEAVKRETARLEALDPVDLAWILNSSGLITNRGVLEQIRSAPMVTEAIQIMETHGIELSMLEPKEARQWTLAKMLESGEIRDLDQDERLAAMEPEGFIPIPPGGHDQVVQDLIDKIDEDQNVFDKRFEEEHGETFSPLLFAGWQREGGAPDEAAHIRMMRGGGYRPWGEHTRGEVSRLTIAAMKTEPLRGAEAAYWRDQFTTIGAYSSGQELLEWSNLSASTRARLEQKMVDAELPGMSNEDGVLSYRPGALGAPQLNGLRQFMMEGTSLGLGYEVAADKMVEDKKAFNRWEAAVEANRPRGAGARAPSFSIPASLRQIPDYESISQDVQNLFRQRLGRDAEDWEIQVLAEDMQDQYRNRNTEMIKAARAAFWQAQGGASGTMEVEVPDPVLRQQAFIEERYGIEIDRLQQTGDTSITNRRMVDAITRGSQMVGSGGV